LQVVKNNPQTMLIKQVHSKSQTANRMTSKAKAEPCDFGFYDGYKTGSRNRWAK
jgi:hypothetical protein